MGGCCFAGKWFPFAELVFIFLFAHPPCKMGCALRGGGRLEVGCVSLRDEC